MNVMIVAGEASGDLHAAALLRELKVRAPGLRAFGMGGSRCIAEGLEALADAKDISVMGITEVLPALPRILGVMRLLERAARERRPDVAVLVDLPDFNLRIAKKLHALGVRVAYYVSPTVWAWRKGRVKTIRKYVDTMMCIFPFEERFYAAENVRARYVGNPVLDELAPPQSVTEARRSLAIPDAPTLALLPGSRMGEIRRILPTMLAAAKAQLAKRPGMQVVIPVAPTISAEVIRAEAARAGVEPRLVDGRAPEVVAASDVAIVASGTAVLEAGLMQRPLVVVYRVSALTFFIARMLVNVAHVAIVNLLAGRGIVPELIQGDMTPARIGTEVDRLLDDASARQAQLDALAEVRRTLGEPGASARAAEEVLALVRRRAEDAPPSPEPRA